MEPIRKTIFRPMGVSAIGISEQRRIEQLLKESAEKRENTMKLGQEQESRVETNPAPKLRYRILRFLEYTGTQEWLNMCLANRGVKEQYNCGSGIIREGILGSAPELLNTRPKLDFGVLKERINGIKIQHAGTCRTCLSFIEAEIVRLEAQQERG